MMRQASSAQVIGSQVGQLPGQTAEAQSDDQPEGLLRMIGVMHRQRQDAGRHPLVAAAVPHGPRAIFQAARRLPWASTSGYTFFQRSTKRSVKAKSRPRKTTESLAAIKDMQDLSSKLRRELEKQFALLIAFERREGTTNGPPTHHSQVGGIELLVTPHQDHRQEAAAPAHKWDRAAGVE
jgi:hypothetical protein